MPHILIVGRNGVGKSTLIRALLSAAKVPVCGVITNKESARPDGSCPVYIHRYGEPRRFSDENLIGLCREGCSMAFPEAFDRFAERMTFPRDGVLVFDELGFMESDAPRFCATVMQALDTAPFLIAAVRDKSTAFLNAVRAHPRAKLFRIDEHNRDDLREQLLRELPVLAPGRF
jgi:nucleoside-triphosphatase